MDATADKTSTPGPEVGSVAQPGIRFAPGVGPEQVMWIANRFRWMLLAALLLFNNAGPSARRGTVGWANLLLVLGAFLAAWVSYRLRQGRILARREVLGISAIQDLLITAAVWLTGGYDSHLFVLYYPSLAVLGLLLPLPASVAYASAVGVVYAGLSLAGMDGAEALFMVLALRWLALYVLLGLAAWAIRHERVARGRAETRIAALQQSRDDVQARCDQLIQAWQSTMSAADAAALARQVEAVVIEIGDDCEEIEAVMVEFSGRAVRASDRRDQAAQASEQIASTARELLSRARPTVAAIEQAHAAQGRARMVVEVWSARAAAVSELSVVVRKVADQTNLLAFNANIEAIQAGERGRRFAVVADEVRQVAEQAIEMAREIDALSVEMSEATHQVLNTLDELGKLLTPASALAALALQVGEQQSVDAETVVLAASAAAMTARDDTAGTQEIMSVVAGQTAAIVRLQDIVRSLDDSAAILYENSRTLEHVLSKPAARAGDTPSLAHSSAQHMDRGAAE